jgi:hypothetical protein
LRRQSSAALHQWKKTVDVTDEDSAHAAKDGILALQIHQGPPMVVQFKDIVLKN